MKLYCTKWALTRGVEEFDGDITSNGLAAQMTGGTWLYVEGEEWHRTRSAGVVRAEVVRRAKISALKKQISKLEKMKF